MAEYNVSTMASQPNQNIGGNSSNTTSSKTLLLIVGSFVLIMFLMAGTFLGGRILGSNILEGSNVQSPTIVPRVGENSSTTDTDTEKYTLGYAVCLSSCPEKEIKGAIIDECRVDCSNILKEKTGDKDILVITGEKKSNKDPIVDITACSPTEFTSKIEFDSCLSSVLDGSSLEPSSFESVIKEEIILEIENLSCTDSLTEFNLNLVKGNVNTYNVHLFSDSTQTLFTQETPLVIGELVDLSLKNREGITTLVGISNNYGTYEGPILVKQNC